MTTPPDPLEALCERIAREWYGFSPEHEGPSPMLTHELRDLLLRHLRPWVEANERRIFSAWGNEVNTLDCGHPRFCLDTEGVCQWCSDIRECSDLPLRQRDEETKG